MSMEKQRKYDREFKLNAVKLYQESEKNLGEVAQNLGLPKSTLYTWVQQFEEEGESSFKGSGNIRSSNEELYRLRKELADVKQERDILKKSHGHLFTTQGVKYRFMRDHGKVFNLEKMAKILGVSRAGYYKFLKRSSSKREVDNQRLIQRIKEAHKKSRGIYGSPRIHEELLQQGETCSRRRIAKLMKKEKIQAKMRKKWKRTTRVDSKAIVEGNHLDQKFLVEEPNKVWVSDITYVGTEEGWLYVAVVLDLFSRKVVGLSMGSNLETNLVIKALKQGLHHRDLLGELMHHSDRGCQYTSKEFRKLAQRHGIRLSMSAKGNCYDNCCSREFFSYPKNRAYKLFQI